MKRTMLGAVCALILAPGAIACEMHFGGYGGAYGMQWQPYNPDASSYDTTYSSSSSDSSDAQTTTQRARPVFSSSATRAAKAAKEQVAESTSDASSSEEPTDSL